MVQNLLIIHHSWKASHEVDLASLKTNLGIDNPPFIVSEDVKNIV